MRGVKEGWIAKKDKPISLMQRRLGDDTMVV
jgi:hypothetical protein